MYAGTFATNEGSKIFRFPAPEETVYFDGCDSEFDTIFTIYTEQQYLAGDLYDYEVQNDDSYSSCGGHQSYLNLPYDSTYSGDYYLVVRPYSGYVYVDSYLHIAYNCYEGADTDESDYNYWDWNTDWYYWYCLWGWDSYCTDSDTDSYADTQTDSDTDSISPYVPQKFLSISC